MNFNWPIVGDKIFGILKGLGFSLKMFDKEGSKTLDPHEATRFFATIASNDPKLKSYSILVSIHDENKDSHVDIKTPNLDNAQDFDFIAKLKENITRNVGDREGLSVNWYKFDHVIQPKDDIMNNITESKDISRPYGTTKSSFQRVGNSKLIIRHTDSVNEEKKGSRWRHIKAIFIENSIGERLHYPYMHIAGARAMARHFSNNGSLNDQIGESIQNLSSDYINLKKASKLIRSTGDDSKTVLLGEILKDINKKVKKLSGPRGYTSQLESLREVGDTNEDYSALHSSLIEQCNCDPNSDEAKYLGVASKYLNKAGPVLDFKVNGKLDLSSRISEFSDQKQRLAWQVSQLSDTVEDFETKSRLAAISDKLRKQKIIDPNDIEFVRTVFKASKGVHNQDVAESITRIKALSGIDTK